MPQKLEEKGSEADDEEKDDEAYVLSGANERTRLREREEDYQPFLRVLHVVRQ